jgi:hypothetical protein
MDPMEEDDPILYRSMVNWIMEDDSAEVCSDAVSPDPFIQMLLADDEEQDESDDDFDVLSFLLREESAASAAAPPASLFSDWDNLFSEDDILDEYRNCRRQQHKTN